MEQAIKMPLLPLRGMVVFPYMIIHLDAGRERSVAALERAMTENRRVLLCAQRDPDVNEPKREDLYDVGTVAEVRQLLKMPGGAFRVLVEGICRAELRYFVALENYDQLTVVMKKD